MPIKRLSQTSLVSFQKHSNMLAGNPAYSPPVYDLLETTLISTNTASVTFSNLNNYSDYKHLQVRMAVKLSNVAGVADLRLRINSDTGSNYAIHGLSADGSSVTSSASTSASLITVGSMAANASDTTNQFGAAVLDILDFGSTNKNKTVRTMAGALIISPVVSGGALVPRVRLGSGVWLNTNAVTSLDFFGTANIMTGSRFSLYGVK